MSQEPAENDTRYQGSQVTRLLLQTLAAKTLETSPDGQGQSETRSLPGSGTVLVLNDPDGSLSLGLCIQGRRVISLQDSLASLQAQEKAIKAAGLATGWQGAALPACGQALEPLVPLGHGPISLACMQLPLQAGVLAAWLATLGRSLPPGTPVLAAGPARDIHRSTLDALGAGLESARTTLAVRKARLAHGYTQSNPPPARAPSWQVRLEPRTDWPGQTALAQRLEGMELVDVPGVFSAGHLDSGSLLLLGCLEERLALGTLPVPNRVLDLGCGNGLLARWAHRLWPAAGLVCCDDSLAAVESCRLGFGAEAGGRSTQVSGALIIQDDCGQSLVQGESGEGGPGFDLILCNPPFHQGRSQTLDPARRMFANAAGLMSASGRLWVVANSHLGHHRTLEAWFKGITTRFLGHGYVVLEARGPRKP